MATQDHTVDGTEITPAPWTLPQIEIDSSDMGTEIDMGVGYQPSLDDKLKRWRTDPVGSGIRQGIRYIGQTIALHVTMQELREIAADASDQSENADWSIAIFNHMWDGLAQKNHPCARPRSFSINRMIRCFLRRRAASRSIWPAQR